MAAEVAAEAATEAEGTTAAESSFNLTRFGGGATISFCAADAAGFGAGMAAVVPVDDAEEQGEAASALRRLRSEVWRRSSWHRAAAQGPQRRGASPAEPPRPLPTQGPVRAAEPCLSPPRSRSAACTPSGSAAAALGIDPSAFDGESILRAHYLEPPCPGVRELGA